MQCAVEMKWGVIGGFRCENGRWIGRLQLLSVELHCQMPTRWMEKKTRSRGNKPRELKDLKAVEALERLEDPNGNLGTR